MHWWNFYFSKFQISKTCLLYFRYSVIISPCERPWPPFIWTILNPLHPGMLCANWLKLTQSLWWRRWRVEIGPVDQEKKIFKFLKYLPLEKGVALHLNRAGDSRFTHGCFVPSLVEIGLVVQENKMKMWKFTDRQMTDGRTTGVLKTHLSFQLRWAKKLNVMIMSLL